MLQHSMNDLGLIDDADQILEKNIKIHLKKVATSHNPLLKVMEYSCLPAGKLFRPKLCIATFADTFGKVSTLKALNDPYSPLSLCCTSLEIHHAYTLVHDDLPCMDDDDTRRGRPSTHKQFSEWEAVLAGDALLHHGHSLLTKIESPKLKELLIFFNWALGAKGLILGQVYDLSGKMRISFENILHTHKLKTARLIQTSLYMGLWCSQEKRNLSYNEVKFILKLGEAIGITFQLLDDLSEGTEELGKHEKEVNPFITYPHESFSSLLDKLDFINKSVTGEEKLFLKEVLKIYFKKMSEIIFQDFEDKKCLIKSQFKEALKNLDDWKKLEQQLKVWEN